MKNFRVDIEEQLELCLNQNSINEIKEKYRCELREIFECIYMLNYLANRIEIRRNFSSKYFNISISCLMEAFSLLINNYSRGASLVLRSALENFIKHILKVYIDNETINDIEINDRSYTVNKTTLDKVINNYVKNELKSKAKSINSKMETEYKKLSGLSHSLVTESENNVFKYFEDLKKVNDSNILLVLDHFTNISKCLYSFGIIINEKSFKEWEYNDLKEILSIVFGSSQTKTYLKNLKC